MHLASLTQRDDFKLHLCCVSALFLFMVESYSWMDGPYIPCLPGFATEMTFFAPKMCCCAWNLKKHVIEARALGPGSPSSSVLLSGLHLHGIT